MMKPLVEPLAQVMANLGVTRGMVVFGQDSLDEIFHECTDFRMRDQRWQIYILCTHPEQFGYERCTKRGASGRNPAGERRNHKKQFWKAKRQVRNVMQFA